MLGAILGAVLAACCFPFLRFAPQVRNEAAATVAAFAAATIVFTTPVATLGHIADGAIGGSSNALEHSVIEVDGSQAVRVASTAAHATHDASTSTTLDDLDVADVHQQRSIANQLTRAAASISSLDAEGKRLQQVWSKILEIVNEPLDDLSSLHAELLTRLDFEVALQHSERIRRAAEKRSPMPTAVPRVYESSKPSVEPRALPADPAALLSNVSGPVAVKVQVQHRSSDLWRARGQLALLRAKAVPLLKLHGIGAIEDFRGHIIRTFTAQLAEYLESEVGDSVMPDGIGSSGDRREHIVRAKDLFDQPGSTGKGQQGGGKHRDGSGGGPSNAKPGSRQADPNPEAVNFHADDAEGSSNGASSWWTFDFGSSLGIAAVWSVDNIDHRPFESNTGASSSSSGRGDANSPSRDNRATGTDGGGQGRKRGSQHRQARPGEASIDPVHLQRKFGIDGRGMRPGSMPWRQHTGLLSPIFNARDSREGLQMLGIRMLQVVGLVVAPVRAAWELVRVLGWGLAWLAERTPGYGAVTSFLAGTLSSASGISAHAQAPYGWVRRNVWLPVYYALRSAHIPWALGVIWGTGDQVWDSVFQPIDTTYHRAEVGAATMAKNHVESVIFELRALKSEAQRYLRLNITVPRWTLVGGGAGIGCTNTSTGGTSSRGVSGTASVEMPGLLTLADGPCLEADAAVLDGGNKSFSTRVCPFSNVSVHTGHFASYDGWKLSDACMQPEIAASDGPDDDRSGQRRHRRHQSGVISSQQTAVSDAALARLASLPVLMSYHNGGAAGACTAASLPCCRLFTSLVRIVCDATADPPRLFNATLMMDRPAAGAASGCDAGCEVRLEADLLSPLACTKEGAAIARRLMSLSGGA